MAVHQHVNAARRVTVSRDNNYNQYIPIRPCSKMHAETYIGKWVPGEKNDSICMGDRPKSEAFFMEAT